MPIKISVAGLAQFMNATSFRQRRLLRDHKFPFTKDGHRKPQIVRYSEARSTIQKYHSHNNDVTVLLDAVEALKKKAAENPNKEPLHRAVRDCVLTFSERSLLISSCSAILRSRARPSLMASTKASNSYRVGSRRAAAGAVLYKGSRAMPRVSPSRDGHTGGS